MEVYKVVHCKIRKGLSAEFAHKDVYVFLDDIEPDTPDYRIDEMVRQDAKEQLSMSKRREGVKSDTIDFIIGEIEGV